MLFVIFGRIGKRFFDISALGQTEANKTSERMASQSCGRSNIADERKIKNR